MHRIKSIDGLRGISILMVIICHCTPTMPAWLAHSFFIRTVGNADLGVKVFFVISGYLITKLLLAEREKTGTISFRKFYIRRILRISPVFYLYIAVVILLKVFFFKSLFYNYSLVLFAGLYLWNYKHLFVASDVAAVDGGFDNGNFVFGHFWSLAMEEQFYLLWPLAFNKINPNKLIKVLVYIILLMPVVRLLTYFFAPGSRGQITLMLHTSGDAILIGCLAALAENNAALKEKYTKYLQSKWLIYAVVLFVFIVSPALYARFKGAYELSIGISLNNVCVLYLLLWSVYVPSAFSKLLNTRLFIQLGTLSYSLYIWQQLFLINNIKTVVTTWPLNLLMVFAVAFTSYHLFEKPILKLKKRFKAV